MIFKWKHYMTLQCLCIMRQDLRPLRCQDYLLRLAFEQKPTYPDNLSCHMSQAKLPDAMRFPFPLSLSAEPCLAFFWSNQIQSNPIPMLKCLRESGLPHVRDNALSEFETRRPQRDTGLTGQQRACAAFS